MSLEMLNTVASLLTVAVVSATASDQRHAGDR